MATFGTSSMTRSCETTAIAQLKEQQAASAAKTQWAPISECECCNAPIAQDETFCETCKKSIQKSYAPKATRIIWLG